MSTAAPLLGLRDLRACPGQHRPLPRMRYPMTATRTAPTDMELALKGRHLGWVTWVPTGDHGTDPVAGDWEWDAVNGTHHVYEYQGTRWLVPVGEQ